MVKGSNETKILLGMITLLRFGLDISKIIEDVQHKEYQKVKQFITKRIKVQEIKEASLKREFTEFVEVSGKKIIVVGGDTNHSFMIDGLRKMGLEPSWFSGFTNRLVYSSITNIEVVVIVWTEISHSVAAVAEKIAIQNDIPIIFSRSATSYSVLEAVLDALNIKIS